MRDDVSADMEAIFRMMPRAAHPARARPAAPARRSKRRRLWILPMLAAAVLIAALAGFMAGSLKHGLERPISAVRAQRVIARPVSAVPVAVPQTPPVAKAANPPEPRKTGPAPAPRAHTAKTPAAERSAPPQAECANDAASAWCLRGPALAADGRLRDAYDKAVRAGVDRSTLVAIRRDWARLRRRAIDHPADMIRGYDALTDDLRGILRTHADTRR